MPPRKSGDPKNTLVQDSQDQRVRASRAQGLRSTADTAASRPPFSLGILFKAVPCPSKNLRFPECPVSA